MDLLMCPHCGTRVVPTKEGMCPSCRQSFQDAHVASRAYKRGSSSQEFPYSVSHSGLAWFALGAAQLISGLGCLAIPLVGLYGVVSGIALNDIVRVLWSLLGTPVAFMLEFAAFVVFARVAELERR